MSKHIDDKDLEKVSGGAVDFGPDQLDQTAGPDGKSGGSGTSTGSGGGSGTDFNQDDDGQAERP